MNKKSIICCVIGIICGAVIIGLGTSIIFTALFGILIIIGGLCLTILSTWMFWLETKLDSNLEKRNKL